MPEERAMLRWISVGDAPREDGELPILAEPFPPRKETDVSDLVSSMRVHGVTTPLLLRYRPDGLQIICGFRRYNAAREAGIETLPALVATLDDAEAIRRYLAESLIRRAHDSGQEEAALATLRQLITSGEERVRQPEPESELTEELESPGPSRAGPTVSGRLENAGRALRAVARKAAKEEQPEPSRWDSRSAESQPDFEPLGERARRILGRLEETFEETLRRRTLPVARVEGVADALADLVDEHPEVDLAFLSPRAGEADPAPAHCLQVAAWCQRVAAHLGYSEDRTRRLVVGGLLHDLGMVFVRDAALRQPALDRDGDRRFLRSHTRLGAAFIQAASTWDREVSLCARDHHERHDGSGYPAGRRGTELCAEARIVSILDSFCTLVSERPHRVAFPRDAALARMGHAVESGLFDADLYRAIAEELAKTSASTGRRREFSPTSPVQDTKNRPENRLAVTAPVVRLPAEEKGVAAR